MECKNILCEKQFIFIYFALYLLIVNFIVLLLTCAWWDLVYNSCYFAFAILYVIL